MQSLDEIIKEAKSKKGLTVKAPGSLDLSRLNDLLAPHDLLAVSITIGGDTPGFFIEPHDTSKVAAAPNSIPTDPELKSLKFGFTSDEMAMLKSFRFDYYLSEEDTHAKKLISSKMNAHGYNETTEVYIRPLYEGRDRKFYLSIRQESFEGRKNSTETFETLVQTITRVKILEHS